MKAWFGVEILLSLEVSYRCSLIPGETGPNIAPCEQNGCYPLILIQKRAADLDCIVEAVYERSQHGLYQTNSGLGPITSCVNAQNRIINIPFEKLRNRIMNSVEVGFKTYMCLICGFIYEEKDGLPDEGIAPGTRWEDVPPNWVCPECGARKEDFEMIEI
jgi:rubredoxin